MTPHALADLEALQREFSTVLRGPLDASTGTLRATPAAYPAVLTARVRAAGVAPGDRLAVYQRQYWLRLFNVLQAEHRLTTALVGAWSFNRCAERFLQTHPPAGHELAAIADGFADFVTAELASHPLDVVGASPPSAAIVEAVRIDIAFRTAMRAPREAPLQLSATDAPNLLRARLVWSRAFTLLDETWPLVALRRQLPAPLGEHRAPLPPRHPGGPRSWVICRSGRGLVATPVPPRHAELLRLLRTRSIAEAVAAIEARGSDDAVAAHVQRWLADGIEHGFWTAIEVSR